MWIRSVSKVDLNVNLSRESHGYWWVNQPEAFRKLGLGITTWLKLYAQSWCNPRIKIKTSRIHCLVGFLKGNLASHHFGEIFGYQCFLKRPWGEEQTTLISKGITNGFIQNFYFESPWYSNWDDGPSWICQSFPLWFRLLSLSTLPWQLSLPMSEMSMRRCWILRSGTLRKLWLVEDPTDLGAMKNTILVSVSQFIIWDNWWWTKHFGKILGVKTAARWCSWMVKPPACGCPIPAWVDKCMWCFLRCFRCHQAGWWSRYSTVSHHIKPILNQIQKTHETWSIRFEKSNLSHGNLSKTWLGQVWPWSWLALPNF